MSTESGLDSVQSGPGLKSGFSSRSCPVYVWKGLKAEEQLQHKGFRRRNKIKSVR